MQISFFPCICLILPGHRFAWIMHGIICRPLDPSGLSKRGMTFSKMSVCNTVYSSVLPCNSSSKRIIARSWFVHSSSHVSHHVLTMGTSAMNVVTPNPNFPPGDFPALCMWSLAVACAHIRGLGTRLNMFTNSATKKCVSGWSL